MNDAVGAHWNRWQAERRQDTRAWTDWGEHPRILEHLQRDLFGSPTTTVFDVLRACDPPFDRAHAVSLCAGDGAFERLLVEHGVFGSVLGIDLADERVREANQRRGALADRLRYEVGDANRGDYGVASCDVVFAKAALHHIADLESMMAGMRRALRPGGRLVTIDFFGPTRFQWTDAQLAAANAFLRDEVPADLRRRADGTTLDAVVRPTPEEVARIDPSEAVRSGELHDLIRAQMVVERDDAIGGTLLNLVFDPTIVNNFALDDARAMAVVDKAVALERDLMHRGAIGCDFRFMIARFG